MEKVTINNYYESTTGVFKRIYKIPKSAKKLNLKVFSHSKYFFDEKKETLYRVSDHWDIVSTCQWQLDFLNERYKKTQKINDTWCYPSASQKKLLIGKIKLSDLRQEFSEQEKLRFQKYSYLKFVDLREIFKGF